MICCFLVRSRCQAGANSFVIHNSKFDFMVIFMTLYYQVYTVNLMVIFFMLFQTFFTAIFISCAKANDKKHPYTLLTLTDLNNFLHL